MVFTANAQLKALLVAVKEAQLTSIYTPKSMKTKKTPESVQLNERIDANKSAQHDTPKNPSELSLVELAAIGGASGFFSGLFEAGCNQEF